VYVVKLKSADKDAALAFCNQLISIIETYPDIMIPPIANLMTTEVLTILNWRLEGPGFTVVDRASTSQDLIRSFIKKVRNASTDVFRVFVTFLSQAGAHECECSGEYVTSDQIARYAMKWIESQSSVLGQLSLMPEQEREAMDVFIRGLRPYEFQAKVRREVDACREAKMWGVGPTADAGPTSETLSALMKFVVHQVEKASRSLNEWHRTMGVKHHAPVVRRQTPFVSSKPHYTSSGHLEQQPPPKPTTSAVKDQVYTPMELKPRCVFCGRANHWCWMCK
ncbi:hypothetical protein ADUPG1_001549, partial [Aduncisulcus paluster]